MPDVFYAGQKDYIAVLNTLATANDVAGFPAIADATAASAAAANVSATNAAAAIGAVLWISGTTYAAGFTVYSALTFRTYRRKVAGAGTTDPSLDATNWAPITLDIVTGLPKIRPTLNLDFANSKTVDPRITFTRASTATYTDALGILRTAAVDAPRIDYDPVTGECKGLLIEESRTNLLTYSEQFDNAAWTKTRTTITPNTTIAPDGTMTADRYADTGEVGSSYIYRSGMVITAGVAYTLTTFFKKDDSILASLTLISAGFGAAERATFNLQAGIVASNTGTGVAAITNIGNGWYKCSLSKAAIADYTGTWIMFETTEADTSTLGRFIWGAQLEAGIFPTSYIPTVASQVTRAADNASMTGANFSSWWNPTEGSLLLEHVAGGNVANQELVTIQGANTGDILSLRYSSGSAAQYSVSLSGVNQANIAPSGYSTQGATYKRAAAYKLNDFAQSINGVAATTDSAGTVPTVSQMFLGTAVSGTNSINGHISKISYFPKRLSNESLQALTS